MPRLHRLLPPLLVALALARAATAQQDPFAPSLRWTHAAPLTDPWIPESACFGGGGEMVWASGNFGSPRLMLLATAGEVVGHVVHEDSTVSSSIVVLSAVTRSTSGVVFSVAQYADPDSLHRRTEITRHDPSQSGGLSSAASSWTRSAGFVTNGPAKIACDASGRAVVAAVFDSANGLVQLDWIRGWNGKLMRRIQVPMSGINVLDVSTSGQRVVLCGGADLYVFETATGATLHHELLSGSTNAVSLSGDGRVLAYGTFAGIELRRDGGTGFLAQPSVVAATNHLPTRIDLSEDGGTLAVGWWNYVTAAEVRYELIDTVTRALLGSYPQVSTIGGLQNFPQAVVVARDGSRAAFGGWGAGGPEPEVLLVERGSPLPLLEIDLPGSVRSLDLAPDGKSVVVGSKNVHANQFGTTGELRLYDTGERDLVQLSPALAGGELDLAAKRTGANAVLFLVGPPAAAPMSVPGIGGLLALDRSVPLHAEFRTTDPTGRADALFGIPADPLWAGRSLGVQALFRMGGGVQVLSETSLTPRIF